MFCWALKHFIIWNQENKWNLKIKNLKCVREPSCSSSPSTPLGCRANFRASLPESSPDVTRWACSSVKPPSSPVNRVPGASQILEWGGHVELKDAPVSFFVSEQTRREQINKTHTKQKKTIITILIVFDVKNVNILEDFTFYNKLIQLFCLFLVDNVNIWAGFILNFKFYLFLIKDCSL